MLGLRLKLSIVTQNLSLCLDLSRAGWRRRINLWDWTYRKNFIFIDFKLSADVTNFFGSNGTTFFAAKVFWTFVSYFARGFGILVTPDLLVGF